MTRRLLKIRRLHEDGVAFQGGRYSSPIYCRDFRCLRKCDFSEKTKPGNRSVSIDRIDERCGCALLLLKMYLLSAGALIIGIGAGMLVSRVFLLLLMKLVGYDGFIALSFSTGGSYSNSRCIHRDYCT